MSTANLKCVTDKIAKELFSKAVTTPEETSAIIRDNIKTWLQGLEDFTMVDFGDEKKATNA